MKLQTPKTGTMHLLRPVILCLSLALVACSHDKVEATQSTKTIIPAVKKTEATIPAKPDPVNEQPVVNEAVTGKLSMLKPGQSASIDPVTTLHYVRLVSDSRCPVGAQCIWAGEATIELTLESGKEKQTFSLTDRSNTKSILGFNIELVSIDRGHLINIRARKL